MPTGTLGHWGRGGYAAHEVLGAALARMVGQIAISTMLQRMPQIRLEPPLSEGRLEDFHWQDNPVFCGLKSLPVVY